MILRYLILSIALWQVVVGFKTCPQVDFCARLRSATPNADEVFTALLDSIEIKNPAIARATFKIQNKAKDSLNVELVALEEDQLRIKISENNSKRYELADSLAQEPPVRKNITITEKNDKSVTLTAFSMKIIITANPFTIQLWQFDKLTSQLDGNRLIMSKNDQSFALQVTFPNAYALYGLHEHTDNLVLRDTANQEPYRLKNVDNGGHQMYSGIALYGAVPVVYGHGSLSSGLFLHNAAQQWYDIKKNISNVGSQVYIMVESGMLDLFLLPGPKPVQIVRQYTNLTGTANIPPFWSLGYHQSSWNYGKESDIRDVVNGMDAHNFSLDVMWLDISYTDGKRYFTWDKNGFPDPIGMQKFLNETHRKMVLIIDPHIKVESNYSVYKGALEGDFFIKNNDGKTNFEGNCWPGKSSWIDFLNPKAREYYGSFYNYDKFNGTTNVIAGFWNDMNEPSVFDMDPSENTMPNDNVHYGGVLHRDIHNMYGLLHTKSTYEGMLKRDPNVRPFILSRSHFAGTQRYAAIWTGDNQALWEHLAISFPECMNANIQGLPFCGADVGGFNGEADEELIIRWYQAGAWLPFYRAHSTINSKRREPYLLSEEAQNSIREALRIRYLHLPTWYTQFYEHNQFGDPVIRPLFFNFPDDPVAANINEELMVGESILVRYVEKSKASTVDVYLPGKDLVWYQVHDFASWNTTVHQGGQWYKVPVNMNQIPIFYRGGRAVFLYSKATKSSSEVVNAPYVIVFNQDKSNESKDLFFVDDHISFQYKNNEEYYYILANLISDNKGSRVQFVKMGGKGGPAFDPFHFEEFIVNSWQENKLVQKRYTKSKDGKLLKDIDISFKNTGTVTIELS